MKEVPVKNVDPVIVDIKKPDFNYPRLAHLETVTIQEVSKEKSSRALRKFFLFTLGGIGMASLALFSLAAWNIYGVRLEAKSKGAIVSQNIIDSFQSLKSLDADKAKILLTENAKELKSFEKDLGSPPKEFLVGALSQGLPAVKESVSLFGKLTEFNMNFLALVEALDDLKTNGFNYFRHDGRRLIQILKETEILIKKMNSDIIFIQNSTSKLSASSDFFEKINSAISENYIKYASDLYTAENSIEGLIGLLDSKVDKHFVLFFNNTGEMRPGGGFIGSYGDLVINEGQMVSLEVQNIYTPDRPYNLPLKVVPPDPLQAITEDWGARDANWFFDSRTSAKTVIDFMEASKIYKEKNITFDGAVAINIHVFKTLLETVGPILVPDYHMTIDGNNFLVELQEEVEAGRDKKAGENPKKILGVIAPVLLDRLSSLPEGKRSVLFEKIHSHILKKDIVFYAKDTQIANALKNIGVDGSVFELPHNFWGAYLAVVNANIAGGKSDALVTQTVEGRIDVQGDGSSFINLKVTRAHSGGKEKDWWWNSDNQNYLQIFVNPESKFISIIGNTKKERKKRPDYESMKYDKNSVVEAIEKTKITINEANTWIFEEFGKSVFATWFTVPAGEMRSLELRYEIPGDPNFIVSESKPFRFIYERQSGQPTSLEINLSAPFGYKWLESDNSIYIFKTEDPKAREIIELHLVKN